MARGSCCLTASPGGAPCGPASCGAPCVGQEGAWPGSGRGAVRNAGLAVWPSLPQPGVLPPRPPQAGAPARVPLAPPAFPSPRRPLDLAIAPQCPGLGVTALPGCVLTAPGPQRTPGDPGDPAPAEAAPARRPGAWGRNAPLARYFCPEIKPRIRAAGPPRPLPASPRTAVAPVLPAARRPGLPGFVPSVPLPPHPPSHSPAAGRDASGRGGRTRHRRLSRGRVGCAQPGGRRCPSSPGADPEGGAAAPAVQPEHPRLLLPARPPPGRHPRGRRHHPDRARLRAVPAGEGHGRGHGPGGKGACGRAAGRPGPRLHPPASASASQAAGTHVRLPGATPTLGEGLASGSLQGGLPRVTRADPSTAGSHGGEGDPHSPAAAVCPSGRLQRPVLCVPLGFIYCPGLLRSGRGTQDPAHTAELTQPSFWF